MAAPINPSHDTGPPMKYQTTEAMQVAIDEYFDFCDNRIEKIYSAKADGVIEIFNPAPYTMSGLARRLGLSRQALSEYKKLELFGDTICEAREKVHEDVENRLMEKNHAGAKFNLLNNFGWRDRTEYKISVGSIDTREKIKDFLDDKSDYDDASSEPTTADASEGGGEMASAPTDIP